MELLETLLGQLFQGINRNNWKRAVALAVVLVAAAAAFAFWASLPQA